MPSAHVPQNPPAQTEPPETNGPPAGAAAATSAAAVPAAASPPVATGGTGTLYGMLFFRVQGRGKLPGLLLAFDGSFDRPLLYREGPEGAGGEPVALGATDAEEEGPADEMMCLGGCTVVEAGQQGGLGAAGRGRERADGQAGGPRRLDNGV